MITDLSMLLDKDAIRDVRARFALALDTRNWELFKTLFTDSVEVDFSSLGMARQTLSPDGVAEMFQRSFEHSQGTQQIYSNFLIDLDGDTATCSSYLLGHHFTPGFEGGDEVSLRGRYIDRFERTGEGWKIAASTFSLFSLVGNARLFG